MNFTDILIYKVHMKLIELVFEREVVYLPQSVQTK